MGELRRVYFEDNGTNRYLLAPSDIARGTGLRYETPYTKLFKSFYYLTYFQRANSISGSGSSKTNVRYYEKGVAKEAGYTDNPTRFTQGDMLNTDFGSFKCSYTNSYYFINNWTSYQVGVPFTQDMADSLCTGEGLQMEFVFRLQNTSLSIGSTTESVRYCPAPNISGANYGFYRPMCIPRPFCYGSGYGYDRSRFSLTGGPTISTISDYSSLTNNFIVTSYPRLQGPTNSTLGTSAHHLCFVLSRKHGFLRIWLDGVLSGNLPVDFSGNQDSQEVIMQQVGQLYHGWQICNVGKLEITQLGYREATWTEAVNYTPPTEAYLAMEDYF